MSTSELASQGLRTAVSGALLLCGVPALPQHCLRRAVFRLAIHQMSVTR